jgi:hypothetical protein
MTLLLDRPCRYGDLQRRFEVYYCSELRGRMNWTRLAAVIACVLLASGFAGTPLALAPQSGTSSKTTPLVLEENEGERRAVRRLCGLFGTNPFGF